MTSLPVGIEPSKFFDLSAEIDESIIQYLDGLQFLRLCLLSRQVHRYLLPLYLRRCHITHSDDLSTVNTLSLNGDIATEDAFRAVRTSPVITTVKHLHCTFHFPEHQLLWEFRSVYSVLLKLQHIHTISLDFTMLPKDLPYLSRSKSLESWQEAFGRITRMMLAKSPSSLNVYNRSCWLWDVSPSPRQENLLYRGMTRIWSPVARTRSLSTSHNVERPQVPRLSRALSTVFNLPKPKSPLEKAVGFVDLTSVTSLTIDSIDLTCSEQALVEPYLTFPSLSKLCVNVGSSLMFDILMLFLHRHPTITALHIIDASMHPSKVHRLSESFLPMLNSLYAPLVMFSVLLGSRSNAVFPRLTDIVVSIRLWSPLDWERSVVKLNSVAQRLEGRTISLRLLAPSFGWITTPTSRSRALYLTGITVLRLTSEQRGLSKGDYKVLVHWLAQFMDLEQVFISDEGRDQSGYEATFVQSVFAQCMHVTRIAINERSYP